MATIREERLVATHPDAAWEALKDWEHLRERLAPGFVIDARAEGQDRLVTFDNGLTVRERRVSCDDEQRRLVWTVVDGPFEHYNGAAQVMSADGERTRFVWQSDVLPEDMAPPVAEMMSRGLDTIKRTLEES